MLRRLVCLATLGGLVTTFGVVASVAAGSANTAPSGQVMYDNTTLVPGADPTSGHFVGCGGTIEPANKDMTGTLIYLQTPNNAHVNSNDHNLALDARLDERGPR